MRFVSLFAGVGGFDLGFEKAGMTCIGQVEIDPKARAILSRNWPNVPKHDDVTTAKEWADELGLVGRTDLVCGGFPCQDVSVAGKRAGLAGERTGLFWDALSFSTHVQAKLFVLENVPGLLSSNQGRDFGVILTALADAGYSHIEWRVLDSQFFGVPQRRRRLFIVGRAGADSGRAVFLEREGVRGNSSEGYASGEESSRASGVSFEGSGAVAERERETGKLQQHARSSQHRNNRDGNPIRPRHGISRTYQTTVGTFTAGAHPGSYNGQDAYNDMLIIGEWDGRVDEIAQGDERSGSRNMDSGGVCPTLNAFDNATETRATVIITFSHTQGLDIQASESVTPTLRTEGGGMAAMNSQGVRRLTPLECERLQGFPDNWTAEQADSNRYKQMGNAITVNVAHYIGTLIMENSNE